MERVQFVYTDLALSGQWGGEIEPCPGGVLLNAAAFDAEGESIGDSWMKNAQLGEALCPSSTSSSSKQEAQKTLQI